MVVLVAAASWVVARVHLAWVAELVAGIAVVVAVAGTVAVGIAVVVVVVAGCIAVGIAVVVPVDTAGSADGVVPVSVDRVVIRVVVPQLLYR